MNTEKVKKICIWAGTIVVVLLFTIVGMIQSGYGGNFLESLQIIFSVTLMMIVGVIWFLFSDWWSWDLILKQWAEANHLKRYTPAGGRVIARLSNNHGKSFFQMRETQSASSEKYFIEGEISGRKVWSYPFTGVPPVNSSIQTTDQVLIKGGDNGFLGQGRRYVKGWCVEIETHKIPVCASIHRRYVSGQDTVNTESSEFEKLYHVDSENNHMVLQLLEPVMIELITNSNVAAYEFSDSSIVLYYTMPSPKKKVLDNMLDAGLKIAEQVDRNFPLGKYEKI